MQEGWSKLAQRIFHARECHSQYINWGSQLEGTLIRVWGWGMILISGWWTIVLWITCFYLGFHFYYNLLLLINLNLFKLLNFLSQPTSFTFDSSPHSTGAGGWARGCLMCTFPTGLKPQHTFVMELFPNHLILLCGNNKPITWMSGRSAPRG